MLTVIGSKCVALSAPNSFFAYICMIMDGIDTLIAVTAILSLAPTSLMLLISGERVLRYIGIDVMAARPVTFMLSRVRAQMVRKAGGPAGTTCALPDRSASFTCAGPPRLT